MSDEPLSGTERPELIQRIVQAVPEFADTYDEDASFFGHHSEVLGLGLFAGWLKQKSWGFRRAPDSVRRGFAAIEDLAASGDRTYVGTVSSGFLHRLLGNRRAERFMGPTTLGLLRDLEGGWQRVDRWVAERNDPRKTRGT